MKTAYKCVPLALVLSLLFMQSAVFAAHSKVARADKAAMKIENHTGRDSGTGHLDNQGGPDAFAYRYVDNQGGDTAAYNWIELRGDAEATWLDFGDNADDGILPVVLGFQFPFYGGMYNLAYVSTNGNLQFMTADADFSNECLPAGDIPGPMICAFWDDLDLDEGGYFPGAAVTVGYRNFTGYTVIEWDSVGLHNGTNTTLKFEAILFTDGVARIQYHTLTLGGMDSTATIGVQSRANGTGLNYSCNTTLHQAMNGLAVTFFQAEAGGISGHVRDESNNPIYQATVTLTELGATTTTDANGYYAFLRVGPGTYSVKATRAGYSEQLVNNVAVNAGQTATANFVLAWYGITPYVSLDVPKAIADLGSTKSILDVAAHTIIGDLNVQITLQHTYDADLHLALRGPTGLEVALSVENGNGGDNYTNTVFDDQGPVSITVGVPPFTGYYIPEEPLSGFNGTDVNGRWTLVIDDVASGDVGTLLSWEIQVTEAEAAEDPAWQTLTPQLALLGNYPNPFNSATQIRYMVPQSGMTTLTLFNVLGQEILTLVEGVQIAGTHQVMWNGRDQFGRDVTSGLYLIRLASGNASTTGKLFLLR